MINMWRRVTAFVIVLFFVLLSDAVLSDWVPGYLQDFLGSPLLMGVMMAVSSMVGFLMDLIFPQLLRQSGVRKLAGGAIVGSLIFMSTLLSSTWLSYGLLLVIAMAAWGIYYELDSFMTQQFVAGVAPRNERSSVWGVVGVVRNLAYFLGPMLGGYVIKFGDRAVVLGAAAVLMCAYALLLFMKLPRSEEVEIDFHSINIVAELRRWMVLSFRIWPILLASFMGGLIDATFWTTGTVLNDVMSEQHFAGGWFMSAYMLPYLFVGLLVAKWGIDQGKKKWAERFLLLGGVGLTIVAFVENIWLILGSVFISGLFLAMAWPLIDSVYTDLVSRAKRGRKHMMGINSATLSLAYVVGPIAAGAIAGKVGELSTFGIMGGMLVVIANILLITTPKKLHLPQNDMEKWE